MRNRDARRFYLALNAAWGAATGLVFVPVMVFQIVQVRLTPLELVLVGTALELTVFVFQVPTGAFADVYSRRLSMVIGYALAGVGFATMAVPSFLAIAAGSALWGLGVCFISGAEEAWIAGEEGAADLPHLFTRAGQASTIAGLAVLPAAILLATRVPNLPIVLGGMTLICASAAAAVALPETGFVRGKRERHPVREVVEMARSGAQAVRSSPILVRLLAAALFIGLCSEGFDRLTDAHILRDAGFSHLPPLSPVAWIGAMAMGEKVLGLGGLELVRRKLGHEPDPRAVGRAAIALLGLQLVAMIIFALTVQPALAVATSMLVMLSRQTYGPLLSAWVTRAANADVRATVISLDGQVDALGQILGGPTVGLLGNLFSIRVALLATAMLLAPALPALLAARRSAPSRLKPARD